MLQPTLYNEFVSLRPLIQDDFESLFAVAADELLWEQHPAKERSQRNGFTTFFDKALQSGGALVMIDTITQEIIGTSRYYEWSETEASVAIGYTFIARKYWGTAYNRTVKDLMLQHAFQFADKVLFYVDSENLRSTKAIEKLGAIRIGEQATIYTNLPVRKSFIYQLSKQQWKG
jgi:RimJ/RimL family protein N-acetyltransferase